MKKFINNYYERLILLLLLFCVLSVRAQKTADNFRNYTLEEIALPTSTDRFLELRTEVKINPANFFIDYGSALGLGKSDEMKLNKIQTDAEGFKHYRFNQYYKNVRVEGAEFIIHVNNEGQTYSANGELIKGLNLNTIAVLSIDDARALAMKNVGAKLFLWENNEYEIRLKQKLHDPQATYFPKGELILTRIDYYTGPKPENYQLAYTFDIHCASPLKSIRIYINAIDGKVVKEENLAPNCATINNAANPWFLGMTCYTEWTGSTYRLNDDCQQGFIWVRDWNSSSLTSNPVEITNPGINNWNSQTQELGMTTLTGLEAARNYFSNSFSRPGWDSLNGNILAYVNARFSGDNCAPWPFTTNNEDNASFNWTTGDCLVGSGCDVPGNIDSWATFDILGHEFTHGVTGTSVSGGLNYSGESGALNESFSDIFGEMVEKSAIGSCDYLEGADRQDAFGSSNPIRSLSNPNTKSDPDTYGGTYWYIGPNDDGGVHTNSGVQNFMFYLLSEGGSGTNDLGNVYSLAGIGNNAASAIAYRALNSYITSTSAYADARLAWINAAKDLYGSCSFEALQTVKAWYAVGIGNSGPSFTYVTCGNYGTAGLQSIIALSNITNCAGGATILPGLPTYFTSSQITLSPGFTASSGCDFRAYITPCSAYIPRPPGSTHEGIAVRKVKSTPGPVENNNAAIQINLSPNPFKNKFNLDLNLIEDAQVSVIIYDIMGKEVDRPMREQMNQKGLLRIQYTNEKLAPGIYFCNININGKRFTEKIVKM